MKHRINRTDYKNIYTKRHYDRISLNVPKGFIEKIKKCADQNGTSVNEYIIRLLEQDISKEGCSRIAEQSRFDEKQNDLLQKWQVAKKYYDMIEAADDSHGYYVLLKSGYINDVSGSRTIQAESMHDIRLAITKSHAVRTGTLTDGLDEQTVEQLKRWQVPRKYYKLIESVAVTKSSGHTIILKEGCINDYTGSRTVHVEKANYFRTVMKYSHELPPMV